MTPAANDASQHLHVLCVDDDADIALIVRLSLTTDPQMWVRFAASGHEAEALWAQGYRPDIVLIDQRLPDMTGIELVARWRRTDRWTALPIVFFTAEAREHDRQAFVEAGAAAVILKPFDPITLAERIRAIAQGRPVESG